MVFRIVEIGSMCQYNGFGNVSVISELETKLPINIYMH